MCLPLVETEIGQEIVDGEKGKIRSLNSKKSCKRGGE